MQYLFFIHLSVDYLPIVVVVVIVVIDPMIKCCTLYFYVVHVQEKLYLFG